MQLHPDRMLLLLRLLTALWCGSLQAADIIPGFGPVASRTTTNQPPVVYRVYLKDGTTRESSKLPLPAFGSVVIHKPGGASESLPADIVDLARSEASWDETLVWDLLDRSVYVGMKLPSMSIILPEGKQQVVQPAQWTMLDLYRSYCQPCHKSLAAVQSWLRDEPRGIDVVAICVDCTKQQLDSIVAERRLGGTARWINARFDQEPDWLPTAMGTSSNMNFLVDATGVVHHANMRPRRKDFFPVALHRVWAEEIKKQVNQGTRQ